MDVVKIGLEASFVDKMDDLNLKSFQQKWECRTCGKECSSERMITAHTDGIHKDMMTTKDYEEFEFECEMCETFF